MASAVRHLLTYKSQHEALTAWTLDELIDYRARHPHPSRGGHWELLERLHLIYQRENLEMAYTMEDFLRETHELVLANMTPEERRKGLDPATIEAWLAKQRRDH